MTLDRFLPVTLILLASRVLPAMEQASVDSATAADQLKALTDPTIVVPSIWLDTEWDQFKHGAEEATWTLAGLWGGALATGKTGLCGLKCQLSMIEAMRHRATPTSAVSAISR